ncbi:helix-turn-helix domain-containing protein [Undibacterium sp. TS12]|uniref:helix-turn-helix domain-containing protein n=1 Tax=Undibacterium sp. TS12 TaxID=2908202 RepID=UPI001F4CA563|nr:helix-turn-helix domain-containing protein [Undibacterium sp. TS12]MCH8618082.1 helix-turn-helix domain-containing protein [Undibacterium sp. TS12]
MQHRQHTRLSYHLLASALSYPGDDARALFAWSVRATVHGMLSHESYLRQAAQPQAYRLGDDRMQRQMSILGDLDANAVADLMQTATGPAQFTLRWNGYNQLAPLGVSTRLCSNDTNDNTRDDAAQQTNPSRQGLDISGHATEGLREQVMAACLDYLQTKNALAAERSDRHLLENLDRLGLQEQALRDVCLYLYEEPWADLPASAKKLACSSRSLQRALHQAGLGFAGLRMAIRLNLVSAAIRRGENSLTGIAHAAGFYDAAHLDHSWKQATGINPSQYRQLLA